MITENDKSLDRSIFIDYPDASFATIHLCVCNNDGHCIMKSRCETLSISFSKDKSHSDCTTASYPIVKGLMDQVPGLSLIVVWYSFFVTALIRWSLEPSKYGLC